MVFLITVLKCQQMSDSRFLKRVVVYSKRYNHVIKLEAHRAMGIHLPTLVLPVVPYERIWGDELFLRYWAIMKTYHTLVSVFFHVPGKGASRVSGL